MSLQNCPIDPIGSKHFVAQIELLRSLGIKEFRDSAGVTVVFFDASDTPKGEASKGPSPEKRR